MTGLFSVAIFLSSFLLFLIEPIAGRRLLPLLGGSAAVWTTCLVFFQVALLLGYLCAHALVRQLKPPHQSRAFLVLLCAALVQLAVTFGRDLGASTAHPILSAFGLLSALIGIPFLALSAASPLLQAWYAAARAGAGSSSPYALYAVSNVGSLMALVAYPTLLEPRLTVTRQIVVWFAGFAVFALVCGVLHWNGYTRHARLSDDVSAERAPSPPFVDRAFWVLLAACASLLLCAVTSYLSQNVAAVPLLWILPLSVYLLSFIVAFNGRWLWPRSVAFCLLAVALAVAGYVLRGYTDIELRFATIPIFCGVLFLVCLFCHGEIYRLRPPTRDLTGFYVSISAGGAIGAFFVGVLAPTLFRGNYELFLGLILASALATAIVFRRLVVWPLFWGGVTLALVAVFVGQLRVSRYDAIMRTRNFYGTLRVTETPSYFRGDATIRTLYNGTIEHGTQYFGTGLRSAPNTYYGSLSGVGLALNGCCAGQPRRVGVIGLGTGTLAAYGRPGDVFRFYEINPLVDEVARRLFTYLSESEASIEVALGDARISLAAEAPQQFDVLAVDAFSGDAIPVHLLTAQAFALYRRHLKPDGILAMHVTNQYLDLAPVVRQEAAHAGMHAVLVINSADPQQDLNRSDWVLVTGSRDFISRPDVAEAGEDIPVPKSLRLWDDDDYSLLPVVRWTRRAVR